jgi:hypothetical protein
LALIANATSSSRRIGYASSRRRYAYCLIIRHSAINVRRLACDLRDGSAPCLSFLPGGLRSFAAARFHSGFRLTCYFSFGSEMNARPGQSRRSSLFSGRLGRPDNHGRRRGCTPQPVARKARRDRTGERNGESQSNYAGVRRESWSNTQRTIAAIAIQKNLMQDEITIEAGRAERHYWLDLWGYRELFQVLAWRDLSVRYKQTVIGVLWWQKADIDPAVNARALWLQTHPLAAPNTVGNEVGTSVLMRNFPRTSLDVELHTINAPHRTSVPLCCGRPGADQMPFVRGYKGKGHDPKGNAATRHAPAPNLTAKRRKSSTNAGIYHPPSH